MHRLFVALRPPPAMRRQLIDTMGGVDGARWQDDEQLHLTLRYIGEVERGIAEDVVSALGGVRADPVAFALSGVGAFDRRGNGHALWAGVSPRVPLAALHRKIDRALVRIGLPPEGRAYLPHITIARLGRNAGPTGRFLTDHAMLASEPATIGHFQLYESHLTGGGARYDAVARFALTDSAP